MEWYSEQVVSRLKLVCVLGFQHQVLFTVADEMCMFEADQMNPLVEWAL